MVIQGYKSAIQTIKTVNESTNYNPDGTDRPPISAVADVPLPTTVASKRLSNASSLFSVSSQQGSPESEPPADTHIPHFLRYAEPPLAMITTVFSLNKRYAAAAVANTLDVLTSFFMPFLDKLRSVYLRYVFLS